MTGLFFGSFNPIHTGHLIIAEFMRVNVPLEEVWFVGSPQNPFKKESELADAEQRLKMVKLAIAGNPKFKSSDVEFTLPTPSYTIDTLSVLSKKFPQKEFALIMGSDNLESIKGWKNYEVILEDFPLMIYKRDPIQDIEWKEHSNIHFFDTPLLNISSTAIRKSLAENKSVRYQVPDDVLAYIAETKLYSTR